MTPKNLVAPIITVAAYDGLIQKDDIEKGLIVSLRVWPYSHKRDTYQLILNGQLAGAVHQLPDPLPEVGSPLTLVIEKYDLAADGLYEVAYRATNVLGGVSADSPAMTIRCDRTAPGGPLLASLLFSKKFSGEDATALVPGYAGMETGDTLHTLCNGIPGPTHTVQPDELMVRPIEIRFEQDFLLSLGAQSVVIDYSVTDRAGNNSIRSLPTTLEMAL